jgi:hypothetical protein
MAKVIQLIEVAELEGKGTEESPYRRLITYYNFDGSLAGFEFDSLMDALNYKDCNTRKVIECIINKKEENNGNNNHR